MRLEFVDHTGRPVRTESLLGKGGQGSVYTVSGRQDVVAKVFHEPASCEQAQKLAVLASLATPQMLKVASWPTATLHERTPGGPVLGFVMPRISGYEEMHHLHGPKSRLAVFPRADWQFLLHVAANLSRAMANLHQIGVVMGDVNDRNVLVSQRGLVQLIDCDSFQITAGGRVFLCPVGVGTHTPPELQGKALDQTLRSANHDAFGLAVLIFQLLFMGRHPFSGRFLGRGEPPSIEEAIADGRFAYASDAGRRQMSPPPHTLPLAAMTPEVATLFGRAFSTPPAERPTATEWTQGLTRLRAATMTCRNSSAHQYLNTLSMCPWCQIERQTGIVLFIGVATASGTLQTGFDVDRTWKRIASIRSPGPLPSLTKALPRVQPPSPRVTAVTSARKRRQFISYGVAAAVVAFCLANSSSNWFLVVVAVIVVAIAVLFNDYLDQTWKESKAKAEEALRLAQGRENALRSHWETQGPQQFHLQRSRLQASAREYRDLPMRRERELQALRHERRERQLHRYLDAYRIDRAQIKDVGPTRLAALQSFGIETAADVTVAALNPVPGFGRKLIQTMVSWRRDLERGFVYNAREPVTPAEIAEIDRRLQQTRAELERTLNAGPETLQQTVRHILAERVRLEADLIEAVRVRRQAEADVYAL